MRVAIAVLGGALLASAPAQAATVVQFINPSIFRPADGFSSSLGALTAVTMDVSITTYRQWFIDTPAGSAPNVIDWSIDSFFQVRSAQSIAGLPLIVNSRGSGTLTQNGGVFTVSALGTGSFNLDPAAFVDRNPFILYESDPGLFSTALNGTTFTTSVPATLFQTTGTCFGSFQGSDLCGSGSLRLTYEYTPFAAAVPEPGTWAMMLIGFGAIGYLMRKKPGNRIAREKKEPGRTLLRGRTQLVIASQ